MPRKVSKRSYRKRPQKARRSKRRYYRRRYYKRSVIKKPEIRILENQATNQAFNGGYGVGRILNLTRVDASNPAAGVVDIDNVKYTIGNSPITGTGGKLIEGSKVRLKYLYIKGYIKVSGTSEDDFNCKLMVFRWKRNTKNDALTWDELINNTINGKPNLSDPSTWTEAQRLELMYTQDWKNDIKINFYRRIKNLYRRYDDANNIIPFRIRIPLYDCVFTCDSKWETNNWVSYQNASTNGLYFTFLSNQYNDTNTITYKYKLYYTDY